MARETNTALNRKLADWFHKISHGEIKLPRFQRFQAWDHGRITSLLETIFYDRPLGITLLLEVNKEESFPSRFMATAPKVNGRVTELLLDGQQRLTALWRSMNDNYENGTYFVYLPEFDRTEDSIESETMMVYRQWRYFKKERGRWYPLWAHDPVQCFQRGLVPMRLFNPLDISNEINTWIDGALSFLDVQDDVSAEEELKAFKKKVNTKERLTNHIRDLREIVKHYNLPHLSLPSNTPKDIALDVFINMNTNTKPLSTYDIIVAEVESAKEESLHALIEHLNTGYPEVRDLFSTEDLVLTTSALMQNKLPNNSGMLNMDKSIMVDNWDKMELGLHRMAQFLKAEGVLTKQILPTNAVLAVIAALYTLIPEKLDGRGKAEILLRKYLWSSFFTDRYESNASDRAYRDYVTLSNILLGRNKNDETKYLESDVPVLNRQLFPLADIDYLIRVSWPKRQNIKARGIICLASRLGARDFADDQHLNIKNIANRDYHHIFPKKFLEDIDVNPDLALNCALISSSTNKSIGAKNPFNYIQEKYEVFDNQMMVHRLSSHLIPVNPLKVEVGTNMDSPTIALKYEEFLRERAHIVSNAVKQLCDGHHITVDSIFGVEAKKAPDLTTFNDRISSIELAIRSLLVQKIDNNISYKKISDVISEKTVYNAVKKYESRLKKNPQLEREEPITLSTVINYLTLSEYKDIIISRRLWHLFEPIFNSKVYVEDRFSKLATCRNLIRHDNYMSELERRDGEASVIWFNEKLKDYIA